MTNPTLYEIIGAILIRRKDSMKATYVQAPNTLVHGLETEEDVVPVPRGEELPLVEL